MFYDYKSDENVQDVVLDCFCPLVEDIEDEFLKLHRNENLSIYAPSIVAAIIIDKICEEIEGTYLAIESETDLLENDDEEVVITLSFDGEVFVERARGRDGLFKDNSGDTLTYAYDSFSKRDIDTLWYSDNSVLVFGFEEELLELVEPDIILETHIDEDDSLHGFHLSTGDENNYHSISFYSTGNIDEDFVEKLIELLI